MYDVSADKISADVDRWITGRNAERDRKILKRRLIDGPTYEQLAAEFDMSSTQIARILYRTSEKLFRHVEYCTFVNDVRPKKRRVVRMGFRVL